MYTYKHTASARGIFFSCSYMKYMYLFVSTDPRYVLMNQHMLLHLEKSVLDHGPLWSSSLFVFEDWNGDLSNYFHGTQNIPSQVSSC